MYFGAAKDLPGVRELLEARTEGKDVRRSRWDMFQCIDYDYFGFGDDDDGLLVLKEKEAEERAIARKVYLWKEEQAMKGLPAVIQQVEEKTAQRSYVDLPSEEKIKKCY
eukprot:UN30178